MELLDDDVENDEEVLQWRRLDTLPPEIILHICSFLSAKFVISVFSRVCKKFQELIECDTTWKMRIFRRWPKSSYPLVPPLEDFDWKAACIAREEQHRLWNDHKENMRKYHFLGAHYGSVNVVQLIEQGKRCLSGGRDGDLKLWNLEPEILSDQPYTVDHVNISACLMNTSHHANNNFGQMNLHCRTSQSILLWGLPTYKAWIWDIAYDSVKKHIYSAGFDCNIKCWDLENPSEALTSYELSSPIVCLAYDNEQLASGCYGRTVSIFDTRTNNGPVLKHILHKKAVICIAADEKHVISGSEDKSVVVYDKVAAKMVQRLEFEWFPLSMSYGDGQLLVGDVNNFLHVIDPTHSEFNLLHTFPTGHSSKVTGVQHSLGSVITCSTDKTIRVLAPHVEPQTIAVIQSTNEVSRISFCNDILACANVDDSISVWVPGDIFD